MRYLYLPMAFAAFAACDNTPTEYATPVVVSGINAKTDAQRNHTTQLRGEEEVPPRETPAVGNAVFHISKDGNSVDYRVIVANIENVFMSHIHMQAPGQNGPIVVWLYPSTAPVPGPLGAGRTDGVLAEGTITAANLVGPLAGHPLSDLVDAMSTGRAYVNLHTNDGVDGVDTGAGDFPGGEIRADIS